MYSRVLHIPVPIRQDFKQLYQDKEDLTVTWAQQASVLTNILKAKAVIEDEEHAYS